MKIISAMRDWCENTHIVRERKLVFFLVTVAISLSAVVQSVFAEDIYQLNASMPSGVDLTAMSGYYADRMKGPTASYVEFKGPLTVDASVSPSNPFRLIGCGANIRAIKGSGFYTIPLMMYNDDGVTKTSVLDFWDGGVYSGECLDIGKYNKVRYGYGSSGTFRFDCATINLHDGAIIEKAGSNAGVSLGRNHQVSVSVIGGSSLTGTSFIYLGEQNKETENQVTAFMGITNATVTAGGTAYNKTFVMLFGVAGSGENCRVVLGSGGVINANCMTHHGTGSSRITFDGGQYKSLGDTTLPLFYVHGLSYSGSWSNPRINVEGINGNPIDVEIAYDRNLADGVGANDYRQVNFTGIGGFTKRGVGVLYFNRLYGGSTCDYTGPTTVLGGGIVVTNSVFKPGRGELALSEGAFLDLNGFDVEFCGATGAGVIKNGATTDSVLTLGYGNADSSLTVAVGEHISIVKTGMGTLTVSGAALANACNLTVAEGKVVFAGDSSSYGTVTVKSGAILDVTGTVFSCARCVKERGGKILPPKGTIVSFR